METSLGELLVITTYIAVLSVILLKVKMLSSTNLSNRTLVFIFWAKLLVGISYLIVHHFLEANDSYDFFSDSSIIFERIKNSKISFLKVVFGITNSGDYFNGTVSWDRGENLVFYNDDRTIIRLNLVFRLFNFGYYHVNSVFYVFISTLGGVLLNKSFVSLFSGKHFYLLLVIFFIPSTLFWGTMGSKEVLTSFFLGMFFWALSKVFNKHYFVAYFILALSVLFLIHLKLYVLAGIFPIILLFGLNKVNNRKVFTNFILTCAILVLLVIILNIIPSPFNPVDIIKQKREIFISFMEASEIGNKSTFSMLPFNSNPLWLVVLTLEGFFNTLFRPLIWDCHNAFMLFSSIENIAIASIVLLVIIFRKKDLNREESFWIFSLIIFVLASFIITGMTVPNAGALVRYKSILLPFLMILSLLIVDTSRLPYNLKKQFKL
jgi:hypothetical protein